MIGLKWSGVTRSDQSCMKHDGIKFRVNYFAHRARILFIFQYVSAQEKRNFMGKLFWWYFLFAVSPICEIRFVD